MTQEKPSPSGAYWQKHVLSWEASAYHRDYDTARPTLWDRLSTYFRGDRMYVRMNAALELLAPYLSALTVLDVGCASGRFSFQLLEAGAARVIGVDVSAEAIEIARQRTQTSPHVERLDFRVVDVAQPDAPLPHVDLTTALGVIEYFDRPALSAFLGNLRTRYFFLDFPHINRRKEFPTWWLRQVYIRVHRLPGVYLYRPEEFVEIAVEHGFEDIWLAQRAGFYYITNLPVAKA